MLKSTRKKNIPRVFLVIYVSFFNANVPAGFTLSGSHITKILFSKPYRTTIIKFKPCAGREVDLNKQIHNISCWKRILINESIPITLSKEFINIVILLPTVKKIVIHEIILNWTLSHEIIQYCTVKIFPMKFKLVTTLRT